MQIHLVANSTQIAHLHAEDLRIQNSVVVMRSGATLASYRPRRHFFSITFDYITICFRVSRLLQRSHFCSQQHGAATGLVSAPTLSEPYIHFFLQNSKMVSVNVEMLHLFSSTVSAFVFKERSPLSIRRGYYFGVFHKTKTTHSYIHSQFLT